MNPSTALATVLVDELRRLGVGEVVLCPGSRSAPLAYAVAASDLRLHVRVDERSAGFLALGLAKLTRTPAAVVTTSGTAVANLHPAVLEAHHAGVPLLVLSADRPAELRGTGANQTTTQPGIFAGAVRWSAEVPAPETRPGQQAVWRSTACRAVAAATGATGGVPGPVHLDLALREPLVPGAPDPAGGPDGGSGAWPEPLDGRPGDRPWVRLPVPAPGAGDDARDPADPTHAADTVDDVERTLVVVGDLPGPDDAARAVAWATRRGWPVLAEPFGAPDRNRVLPHGPLLLTAADWLRRHRPDRVVTVGRVTLARPVAALTRRPDVVVEHVSAVPEWTDPGHVVHRVHPMTVLGPGRVTPPGAFARAWTRAGERLAAAVAADPAPWPSGLAVAGALGAALPEGALLVTGSSNPVRDLDLGVARLPAGVRVVGNRGLAGIDGCVSTAVGVALAAPRTPCYALVGDLTFLHDSGGLLIGPDEPRPDLTLVVVNDDGGGIFTLLEPGDPGRSAVHGRVFERVFATPTGTDVGALCRAHGVGHEVAATPEALAAAVAAPPDGLRVVEVPLPRDGHRQAHARLRRVAASALAGT